MAKEKNFIYELAEIVHAQEAEIIDIMIEHFEENFKEIPQKYKPLMWMALTKDLQHIPKYIEFREKKSS